MLEIQKITIIRFLLTIPFLFAMIFIPAWNLRYWQGWFYFLLNIFVLLITIIVLWNKPTLLEGRINIKKEMLPWDKLYFTLSTPIYFISIILSILDFRFKWYKEVSIPVYIIAVIIYILCHGLFLWAKYVNEFLSTIVCVQPEKGHNVCNAGPYKYIRHPAYLAGILFGFTGPLILGSYIGVILLIFAAILLVWRTKMEDEYLKENLKGYKKYTEDTKYRLFPGLW